MAESKNAQVNKRTPLNRLIIDTPALLNMVKHCRESDTNIQGCLMGVTQRQAGETEDSLLVTQTMAKLSNTNMGELMRAMENESQKLMDTNEVGFYITARMGLCFNINTLTELLNNSKKFKNAIMVTYDTQKSNYGLNPLRAYRLSEKAIATFTLQQGTVMAHFV